ncbi:MAG: DUF4340 domain-containing protein [Firmicutes bacterium]|nr:DUF4340 domain-containing protein [Bacillota bacterium]
MSFKRTIVIALLFLVVGGLYYHFQILEKPKKEEAKLKETALFTLKPENVTKLDIKRYPEEFVFEKKGDEWMMTAPAEYKADPAVINNIVQMYTDLHKIETVEEKISDAKQFGLEIPKFEITLSDGKTTETVQLGAESVGGKSLFAKMEKLPAVFTVDSGVSFNLKGKISSFRDKTLFPAKPENIEKVVVHSGGATYLFEQKDGKWNLSQPPVPRADSDAVTSYIMTLLQIKALDFQEDNAENRKKSGLEKTDDYLEVYEKGKTQPVVLKYAIPDQKGGSVYGYIENSGELLTINPAVKDILAVSRDKLIKLSLFDFEVDKLGEVSFKWGNNSCTLKKSSSQNTDNNVKQAAWNMVSPEQKGLENEVSFGLIAVIRNLYVRDSFFLEDKPAKFGLDKPELVVTGKREDGKDMFTLTVGGLAADPNFYYVRANDESTVEIVQKEAIVNLLKDLNKLIGKEKPAQDGKTVK